MKSYKFTNYLVVTLFGVALEGYYCQSYSGTGGSISSNSHYSKYPAYLSQPEQSSYKTNSFSPNTNGGDISSATASSLTFGGGSVVSTKDFDLKNNAPALGAHEIVNSDQGSNTIQVNPGYNNNPTGQQTYYYETYQQPYVAASQQAQQRCYYTGNGMKCRKRNSAEGQVFGNGFHRQDFGGITGGSGIDQDGDDSDGGAGAGLGGLAGLIGLLGVKGLKALTPFALLLPLLPILLPIIPIIALIALSPLLLLLLFVPIPVIVTPTPGGRSDNISPVIMKVNLTSMAKITADVLQSDECIERLSCEIGRMSKRLTRSNILERFASSLPMSNRFAKRVYDGLMSKKDAKEGQEADSSQNVATGDCSVFVCKARAMIGKRIHNNYM